MADSSDNEVYVMPEGTTSQYAPVTDANVSRYEESNVTQYTAMTDANIPQYAAPAETKTSEQADPATTNPFANLQTSQLEISHRDVVEPHGEKDQTIDHRPQNNMSPNFEQGEVYQQAPASSEEEEDNFIRKATACLISLFLASVVVTAQASQDCVNAIGPCESWGAWAVALGLVSTLFSFYLVLTMTFLREKHLEKTKKTLPYFSVFLTIWWVLGVATCTFDGPFDETGNGFFATWLALLFSMHFCQITISRFDAALLSFRSSVSSPYQRVMGMMMVLSFAVAYSCLLLMDDRTGSDKSKASPQEIWGISCGIISGVLIVAFLILEPRVPRLNGKRGYLAYFLIPWWLFGAGVLTFDEPFTQTGNGYFCAWGCFCGSCYLFYLSQTVRAQQIIRTLSNLGSNTSAV